MRFHGKRKLPRYKCSTDVSDKSDRFCPKARLLQYSVILVGIIGLVFFHVLYMRLSDTGDDEGFYGVNLSIELNESKYEDLHEEVSLWDRAAHQKRILSLYFDGLQPDESPQFQSLLRKRLNEIPQCEALGSPFLDYLQKYLYEHYFTTKVNEKTSARLIYSCESHMKRHFCGGMGDRFKGITTAFWLALLSRRRFEIYHPTPVPIQKYMQPYLVNFIPHRLHSNEGVNGSSAKRYRESLSSLITTARVNQQLMRIGTHKSYILWQKNANQYKTAAPRPGSTKWWRPQYVVQDIRVQTNSPGIDDFLYKDSNLYEIKTKMLGLGRCNITCYSGCLSHILFQPDTRLWTAALDVLGVWTDKVLKRHLDGVQYPHPGLTLPFVGLQLRMGGAMAAGMRIRESVRTFPSALPHYYSLLSEVLTGNAWQNRSDLFPINYTLRERFSSLSWMPPLTLFVTSDSIKVVQEVMEMFHERNNVRVVYIKGESYQHTDTMNLDDADRGGGEGIHIEKSKERERDKAYFYTLLGHYLLSLASHVVFTQSGFGDTAFWRGRQVASAIFIDVTPRHAWQHHMVYRDIKGFTDLSNDSHAASEHAIDSNYFGRSAESVLNRVLVNFTAPPTSFYVKES